MSVEVPNARPERVLWSLLALLGLLAMALLAVLVAARIGYPFELEWMEGAMVDEAARVHHGLDVFAAPSLEHVPFLYTPLFYYLAAMAMAVCGDGFVAGRLVSVVATAACCALIFGWVWRATGRRIASLAAAGLFCCGYGWLQTWYDLGRSDMVFVAAMLTVAHLLRSAGRGAAVLAAAVAVLAFLTKQTALLWLPWLAVGAWARNRATGAWFVGAAAVGLLATVLGYHLATDGWFTFFVFEMPRRHAWVGRQWYGFWTKDMVPITPLLATAVLAVVATRRSGRGREAVAVATFGLGGITASYLSRLHVGGFDNVLVFGFTALCCIGPTAAVTAASARARAWALALLVAQFALLVVDVRALGGQRPWLLYDPRLALPHADHRQATAELLEFVRQQPGAVWLPFHGHLGPIAGKQAMAHAQALYDLLPYANNAPAGDRVLVAMGASLESWLRDRRLAAVVLEQPHGALLLDVFHFAFEGYERRPGELLTVPTAIRPLIGMVTDSPYAMVPRH